MGEMLLNGRLYGASGIRELTQAQYDALPASKLTDGILYCIKDTGIVEGDKYAPVIYSLEEREIGVWTDGKPLYQKTITFTTGSTNAYHRYNTGMTDIDVVFIDFNSTFYVSSSTFRIGAIAYIGTLSGQDDSSNITTLFEVFPNKVNDEICIDYRVGLNARGKTAYVTIQYTKTTDIPGSGHWGTDGVPMVHYDGNEKIIGTWFGETLYEKTIKTSFTASATTLDINFDNASRDMLVVSFKGVMFASNDGATLLNRNNVVFNDCYVSPTNMFTVSTITGWDYVGDGIRITKAGADTYGTAPIVYLTIQYTKRAS